MLAVLLLYTSSSGTAVEMRTSQCIEMARPHDTRYNDAHMHVRDAGRCCYRNRNKTYTTDVPGTAAVV